MTEGDGGVLRERKKGDTGPDAADDCQNNTNKNCRPPNPPINITVTINAVPVSEGKQYKPDDKKSNWTEVLAFVAAVGAILAAIFSGWQAWIANDTEKRQLRPFAGIDHLKIVCADCSNFPPSSHTAVPGDIVQNSIALTIRNSGATPARKLFAFVNLKEVRWGAALPRNFDFPDAEVLVPPGIRDDRATLLINPNDTKEFVGPIYDIAPIARAQSKQASLYFYGHLDYIDLFDSPHTTIFCYHYEPWTEPMTGFYPCPTHNDIN